MAVSLGHLVQNVQLKHVHSAFKDAACGGVITDDIISPQHIALMSPEAIKNLQTFNICFMGERDVVAEVLYLEPTYKMKHFRLGDEETEQATGLPLDIQRILKQDLVDYFNLTGRYTSTRLDTGIEMRPGWKLALGAPVYPHMVRDLSGHGLYIASPYAGSENSVPLESGPNGKGLYARDEDIARLQEEGLVRVDRQPAGSRIICKDRLLTKQYPFQPQNRHLQLRARTGGYDLTF